MASKTKYLATFEKLQKKKEKKESPEPGNYTKHKFKQAVIKTLLKKESNQENTEEKSEEKKEEECSEEKLEIPDRIGAVLNLAKKKLRELPEVLFNRMQSVQYLYLEGNRLTKLPENFFDRLCNLKWLDLRNNCLLSLPTIGLKQHTCLEYILLQGNRIRVLPLELATIPTLKGLQTTGNPITNVPYDAIAQGFRGVLKHLQKLCEQDNILLPKTDSIVLRPSSSKDEEAVPSISEEDYSMGDNDKLSKWRHFMKKKSGTLPMYDSKCNFYPGSDTQHQKISVSVKSQPRTPAKLQPFRCGVYNKNKRKISYSALHYKKLRNSRLGYKKKPITMAMIQEKARKEWFRAQMRDVLEAQAKKIQRMRDKEVLKSWRDHSKLTRNHLKLLDNYQQYPSKDFAHKTPFDVDPDFLNMLNRVDIYRSLKDYEKRIKKVRKPRIKITSLDLERQMNEIVGKLQNLDTNDGAEVTSPRSKHTNLCHKMSKILEIQKTLRNLQNLNSSMNGLIPFIKPKPKPRPMPIPNA